jgi:WhiB family redox-sensing transcriptional regulator
VTVLYRSVAYSWSPHDDPADWPDLAACAGVSTDVFFPVRGASYAAAKAICARCPVTERCRAEIDRVEGHLPLADAAGLYAGETPGERRRRRRSMTGV